MKKKILGDSIQPKCRYCIHSVPVEGDLQLLCPKSGVVTLDGFCKKFSYDPLKRVPQEKPSMMRFSAADFSLD